MFVLLYSFSDLFFYPDVSLLYFLMTSFYYFLMSTVCYFSLTAYILQQTFSSSIKVTMWLHSIFLVNKCNEYKQNHNVFHIPHMIKHFTYYRWKPSYFQEPTYIHFQAICYSVAKCKQARLFVSANSFTGRLHFAATKTGPIILLFTSKDNLTIILKESQIYAFMYENISARSSLNLRVCAHSPTVFNQESEGRNGYKKIIITFDHAPTLTGKVHQLAIARLPLFLFPDLNEHLAQLSKVCLPKL